MVAFVTSLVIGIAGCVGVILYGRHRPVGAPLTWGQAMLGATYVFFLFLWWYGVIPHQWLTWADNELGWRPDKIVLGPADIFEPNAIVPFTISYQTVRDIIASAIYGLGLALHVAMFAIWQGRGKPREVVATSTYGRPLVRRG
jgi:hypothetical protein